MFLRGQFWDKASSGQSFLSSNGQQFADGEVIARFEVERGLLAHFTQRDEVVFASLGHALDDDVLDAAHNPREALFCLARHELGRVHVGGELLRFETGPDLLRFLQTSPPDRRTCVFLDINMPILSGFDTADQLLTLAHAGSGLLEVHLLSSSDSLADRQRAAERPLIRSYLVKPLSVAAARAVLGLGA